MTITLKEKIGLVVPRTVQRQAGIKTGDRVKFEGSGGVITITAASAKVEGAYTPAQRSRIDAGLARAEKQLEKGNGSPVFNSIEEFAAALNTMPQKPPPSRNAPFLDEDPLLLSCRETAGKPA